MTTAPIPPCECETCSGLRSAIAALELPVALTHDDGSLVMVDAGGTEISAAEAWLRRLIADTDRSTDQARALLAEISGTELGSGLTQERLRQIQRLVLDNA